MLLTISTFVTREKPGHITVDGVKQNIEIVKPSSEDGKSSLLRKMERDGGHMGEFGKNLDTLQWFSRSGGESSRYEQIHTV